MIETLSNIHEFQKIISEHKAVLIYFSHDNCNVCKVLKPKIDELFSNHFEEFKLYYANTVNDPQTAAQNSVFTVPTVIIFLEGKEFLRKSRNISIQVLKDEVERTYQILFEK